MSSPDCSQVVTVNIHVNSRPFQSYFLPQFQNESPCKTFQLTMSLICKRKLGNSRLKLLYCCCCCFLIANLFDIETFSTHLLQILEGDYTVTFEPKNGWLEPRGEQSIKLTFRGHKKVLCYFKTHCQVFRVRTASWF